MRNVIPVLGCVLLLSAPALVRAGKKDAAAKPEASPAAAKKMEMPEMESHTLVLLVRGDKAAQFSDKELEELQTRHLAHLDKLAGDGKIIAAGPFSDQTDETIRGACVYSVPVAEAITLASEDPMVKAGRLKVTAMTWWTAKGYVSFPKAPAK